MWLNYEFEVYPQDTYWNAVGGVYIFCGLSQQNRWVPLYIGQAESLAARLPTHARWQEAARLGATHIHVRVVQARATRDAMEQELIQAYRPQLSTQLKPS